MIYLGIDSGTQSTKAIALDLESGDVIASAQSGYSMVADLPPGHLEQHPQDWIQAVSNSVGNCVNQLGPRKSEVAGIGVSGQQHGLVVLDDRDRVIRPAKLWCDTSTSVECAAFNTRFEGAKGLIELAGNAILPGYTAPKILWLKRYEPENFARARSFLLPHDYINFWLTGEKRMEYGDASGTGLMDVRSREWSRPLCDFIEPGFADRLPALGSSHATVGHLRDDLRRAWGLSSAPLVSAGGGDNMMGAIGTGNIQEGIFTASFGTSGTLYAHSERPVIDHRGEVAAFCDSTDRWLPLVCTMNVTVATEQIRKLFGWTIDQFNAAVSEAPPGSRGVLFLPYLNGERTPNLPNGTGVFHGLNTENTTPVLMARAAMEGATMGLAYGLDRFQQLGLTAREIRLTGGGSKSKVWRQMAADVFGVDTVCLAASEGAALGGAIQAAACHSGKDTLPEITSRIIKIEEATRCRPMAGNHYVYQKVRARLDDLTQTLREGAFL